MTQGTSSELVFIIELELQAAPERPLCRARRREVRVTDVLDVAEITETLAALVVQSVDVSEAWAVAA